jgi:hypothetical protein
MAHEPRVLREAVRGQGVAVARQALGGGEEVRAIPDEADPPVPAAMRCSTAARAPARLSLTTVSASKKPGGGRRRRGDPVLLLVGEVAVVVGDGAMIRPSTLRAAKAAASPRSRSGSSSELPVKVR